MIPSYSLHSIVLKLQEVFIFKTGFGVHSFAPVPLPKGYILGYHGY